MQKKSITLSLLLLSLAQAATADTFIMKDGSKITGNILRQDEKSYVIEVQFTKSIKEEKTIAKADVEKIQREQLDLTAFVEIEKLTPTPDILTANDYDVRIKKVEKFLIDHRGSDKSKQAKAILATLKAEQKEVLDGGIKLGGKMIPTAEYKNNLYDIDSRIQEEKIRTLIKSGQTLAALRAFNSFTQDFRNTSACSAILPTISQVITSYQQEIDALNASFEARTKARIAGLERMTATDRATTELAIKEESQQSEALLTQEKNTKVGWVTINPYYKPSLDEASSFSKQSLALIAAMKTAPQVDGGKLYRDALALLHGQGDATAVNSAISAAKNAAIAPRYITILEDAAKAKGIKN